jgi:hypothetical protein
MSSYGRAWQSLTALLTLCSLRAGAPNGSLTACRSRAALNKCVNLDNLCIPGTCHLTMAPGSPWTPCMPCEPVLPMGPWLPVAPGLPYKSESVSMIYVYRKLDILR